MESLRRPAVYEGVTYPEYEMDFYTSNVYSARFKDKILKPKSAGQQGYLGFIFSIEGRQFNVRQHKLLAQTFPDVISESPIVSYYGLKIGRRHESKTPTGFTFLCNLVCPDHIDGNKGNNHHTNLMLVTQSENNIKCGPRKGKRYKGVTKEYNRYRARIRIYNILDEDGRKFEENKCFATEEEAALAYNTMLEEALLTVWGPDLGPKIYDLAYKNEVPTPVQQQLILK